MASTSRLAKNVTEDYLTCTICLQRYKEPKTLPCEHSFCLSCLASHIQASVEDDVFLCPVDKSEIKKDADSDPWKCARDFDTDPLVAALIRAVEENQRREHVCTNGEVLDFFCFGCKKLVSAENAVENHRNPSCDCVNIQKAYQRVLPMLMNYGREVEKIYLKSEKVKRLNADKNGISEAKQEVLNQIDQFESKLDDFYLTCKQSINTLKSDVSNYRSETEESENEHVVHDDISQMYSKFNGDFDDENITELMSTYINIENGLKEIGKLDEVLQNISSRKFPLDFIPNKNISDILRSEKTCGALRKTKRHCFKGIQADDDELNYYDIVITEKYIVTCDGENGTLQRFLHDGSYVDNMKLENVCRMSMTKEDEIAATRLFKRKVAFVSLGKRFNVKDQIKTKKPYIGICALSTGNLCVSFYDGEDPPGIDIISSEGKVLKTVLGHRNMLGPVPLFLVPMFLSATPNDNIIVCDFTESNHLICFSDSLELLWCKQFHSMPCSVTCDDESVIYVSFPDENEVLAIHEEDGQKLRTIVKKHDNISRPYAISCYDKTLIITEDETDKIHMVTT